MLNPGNFTEFLKTSLKKKKKQPCTRFPTLSKLLEYLPRNSCSSKYAEA